MKQDDKTTIEPGEQMKQDDKTKIEPISPDQAKEGKPKTVPWMIIQAVNELLTEGWQGDGRSIQLDLNTIIDRACGLDSRLTRQEVFRNKWLDIEDTYRAKGWTVSYESSDYTDSRQYAYLKFTPPRGK